MKSSNTFVATILIVLGLIVLASGGYAAKSLIIHTDNLAAKSVTSAKIQGGAVNTVPRSDADGGVAFTLTISGSTGRILCQKSATAIGYCSDEATHDGGVCTCN